MAISSFKGSSGSAGGGGSAGFHVPVGSTGYTTFTLPEEQPAGAYWITSNIASDYTYDIYVASEDGTFSGYTTTRYLDAAAPVKYVVIYGATADDLLVFDYKVGTTAELSGGVNNGVGPYATSVSIGALPNIDDSTVLSGGNFGTNVDVTFTGTDLVALDAKSIVRNSSRELVVTRPDALDPNNSPYTLTVTNPGIPNPTDGRNVLSDAITAGTYPGWITQENIFWTLGLRTSYPLVAEDVEQTDVDYEIISGTLLSGLTLDQETGAISGDDSSLTNGQSATFTVRATDAGGNTADKEFTLTANSPLVWITPSGSLGDANTLANNTYILDTDPGDVATNVVYTVTSGQLPPGLTLSESGSIAGQATGDSGLTYNFTVTATDDGEIGIDREFSLTTSSVVSSWYFDAFASAGGLSLPLFLELSL